MLRGEAPELSGGRDRNCLPHPFCAAATGVLPGDGAERPPRSWQRRRVPHTDCRRTGCPREAALVKAIASPNAGLVLASVSVSPQSPHDRIETGTTSSRFHHCELSLEFSRKCW